MNRRVFAAVFAALLLPAAAGAAVTAKRYSPGAVLHAFTSHGIKMGNDSLGTSSPVTTLAATKAHEGWNVAAYVYATIPAATRSYAENVKSWNKSGFASERRQNVIVVVVAVGRSTQKKAKAYPMPSLVKTIIASFAK